MIWLGFSSRICCNVLVSVILVWYGRLYSRLRFIFLMFSVCRLWIICLVCRVFWWWLIVFWICGLKFCMLMLVWFSLWDVRYVRMLLGVLVGLILVENLKLLVVLNFLYIVVSKVVINVGDNRVGVLLFRCRCFILMLLGRVVVIVFSFCSRVMV